MDEQPGLRPQDEAFIDEAVRSGRYGSRAEVLSEGLRLVREREAQWARFNSEIQKGLDSLDRGEGIALDEAFDRVRASIRAKRDGRKDAT